MAGPRGVPNQMIKRGILNSKSEYWVHFHPKEYSIYYYYKNDLLEWIEEAKPKTVTGKSKDGSITGKGYLVPKSLPFISHIKVPRDIVDYFDWANGTDREKGLKWGEKAIRWCLSRKILTLPIWSASPIRDKDEQYASVDYQLRLRPSPMFEVKTETVESSNLYVQTHELNHKVHITESNDFKYTEAEGLK